MQRVAIVFHSSYGTTEKQAHAVGRGVRSVPGSELVVLTVEQALARFEDLNAADAIVFGAPTYMGSASGAFKAFMEETANRVWAKQEWRDKLAAGFTSSAWPSGDKLQTLVQLSLFAAQHGMVWLGLDVLSSEGDTAPNRLGSWLGSMARSSPSGPTEGDLKAAERLGERVAEWAARLRTRASARELAALRT